MVLRKVENPVDESTFAQLLLFQKYESNPPTVPPLSSHSEKVPPLGNNIVILTSFSFIVCDRAAEATVVSWCNSKLFQDFNTYLKTWFLAS